MLKIRLFVIHVIRSMPFLHRAVWKMRKAFNATKRLVLVRRPVVDAAPFLKEAIRTARPYAAGKMGSVEALGLAAYLKRKKARANHATPPEYKPYLFHTLHVNAGVFPQETESYDRFGETFLPVISACDMLVSWDVAGEAVVISGYAPGATLVRFRTLEPFFASDPWTSALQGKKVLVISPFVQSITRQYAQRETLWDNPAMLPEFQLLTLQAPLSAALVKPQDNSWFAAVERMKSEMSALDYDVALIGAGAFSLPLAVHAKNSGKIGIHLGGSLQILFGVAGERWKRDKDYSGFIKPSWRKPSSDETPQATNAIENGCYW